MKMRNSRSPILVVMLIGALGVTACDDDSMSATPEDLVQRSADLTASQSIFTTQVPATLNVSDGASVNYELGVRFKSSTNGLIVGLRFYKSPKETGTHIGHVWTAAGTLLATATFAGESASGWQQQALSTPLDIQPSTEYVVTVNTGNTYYSATDDGLASSVQNGSLSTIVGNNGVFGAVGKFPTQAWQASNYFRDVVFSPTATTPPPPSPPPPPTGGLTPTRYVATTGSDSNPGTQSQPWKTIQKAASSAVPGDVISLAAGTYNEGVTFSKSGNATHPVTFVANGNVVVVGNLDISGDYVSVIGVTDSPSSAGRYNAITVEGQHDVLQNCTVVNYGATAGDQATAIGIGGAYNLVQGCTIQNLNDIDAFHVFGHDQTIRGNTVTHLQEVNYSLNHTDFIQSWGTGSGAYNILVENNVVTNSSCQLGNLSTDGRADLHDWTFRNNVFANIDNALFSGIPKTYYYDNVFYNVGKGQGYAVSLYNTTGYSSVGDQFMNNVFLANVEDIHFHDGTTGTETISNNYFGTASFAAVSNGEVMGSSFVNGGNPGFVNPAGLNFHLTSTSLLSGKGKVLLPAFPDADGQARPTTGAWNIGAY